MDKQIYLDLTPIDNGESSSIYINVSAIQAIENCNGGSLVRIVGHAYEVRESRPEIIEMLGAEVKWI